MPAPQCLQSWPDALELGTSTSAVPGHQYLHVDLLVVAGEALVPVALPPRRPAAVRLPWTTRQQASRPWTTRMEL